MYIRDTEGYGLGNFISCTPVIRELYEQNKEKVRVYFTSDYIKECYKNSPYIETLEEPQGRMLFQTSLKCKTNIMRDIDFIQDVVLGYRVKWDTFIDDVEPIEGEYGVFVNGAGSEADYYLDQKLIDEQTQQIIKEQSKIKVFGIGSINDKERNIFEGSYGDIRECLRYIKGAKWVISNVTGFYHVAGAYKKRQLVLWKDCLYPRNENMNTNAVVSHKGNWVNDIKDFLNEV